MNIIFLDIDGVLVTRKSITERSGINAKFDPVAVRRLNRIVKSGGGLSVSPRRKPIKLSAPILDNSPADAHP